MRLIKPAILVLALTVLVTSIGNLFLGWQFSSLNTSLCMLLLGLILLQAQNSGPGERSLPPSGVRLLGAVGVILSGLVLARGLYRSDVVALLALPALGQADVERIVAARGERGGFRDMDDLVSAASLQPHQLVALQDRVVFGEFTRPGSQGHGRVLDL